MRVVMLARIALGAFGLWVLSIGARGLLRGHPFADNAPVGRWLLGGVIVHDGLIAPTVFVLCAIAYWVTSVRVRQALAAILLIGGSALIVGLPDLLRKGHNSNPTVTPLDYRRDLVIVLLAVVGGVVLVTVVGARGEARRARRQAVLEAAEIVAPEPELEREPEPDVAAELVAELEPELEPEPESEPQPPQTESEEPDSQTHPHTASGIGSPE